MGASSRQGPWRAMAAFGAGAECAGCYATLRERGCYQVWVPRRKIPGGRYNYCKSCAELVAAMRNADQVPLPPKLSERSDFFPASALYCNRERIDLQLLHWGRGYGPDSQKPVPIRRGEVA